MLCLVAAVVASGSWTASSPSSLQAARTRPGAAPGTREKLASWGLSDVLHDLGAWEGLSPVAATPQAVLHAGRSQAQAQAQQRAGAAPAGRGRHDRQAPADSDHVVGLAADTGERHRGRSQGRGSARLPTALGGKKAGSGQQDRQRAARTGIEPLTSRSAKDRAARKGGAQLALSEPPAEVAVSDVTLEHENPLDPWSLYTSRPMKGVAMDRYPWEK